MIFVKRADIYVNIGRYSVLKGFNVGLKCGP